MGVGAKDIGKNSFTLPSHAEDDLSPQESADIFADYFSTISHEFDPICVEDFPPSLKLKIEEGKYDRSKPVLEEWQIYDKLRSSKKPNSTVPGDWFDICTNILGKMMVITAPSRRVTWAEYLHMFATYSLY